MASESGKLQEPCSVNATLNILAVLQIDAVYGMDGGIPDGTGFRILLKHQAGTRDRKLKKIVQD